MAAQLSRPARPVSPGEIHAQLMAAELPRAVGQFTTLISQIARQMHERRTGVAGGTPAAAKKPAPAVAGIEEEEEVKMAGSFDNDDTFIEEQEEEDADVTDIIGGDIENKEEG